MAKMQYSYDAATSYLYELGVYDPREALKYDHHSTNKEMHKLGFFSVNTVTPINNVCSWIAENISVAPYWCYAIPFDDQVNPYYIWYFKEKKDAMLFKLRWGS